MLGAWLRAILAALVVGPSPLSDNAVDAFADNDETADERSFGHTVRGPGFHVWEEDAREAHDWSADLLRSTQSEGETAIWRDVAIRMAARPAIRMEPDADLALGLAAAAGEAGMPALGLLLCLMPSLDRTCLISSCATSADERTRLALAHALFAPFDAVGVQAALDHLQRDPSQEVRRAALTAAEARRAVAAPV